MKKERLHLYLIDLKYNRDLAKADDNVMSISPQERKENRPFIGIIVICSNQKYCIPLSSPKQKHFSMKNDKDFSKIYDKNQNLIGVLNFNAMIPVDNSVVTIINLNPSANDSMKDKKYKELMNNQLDWCNSNHDAIEVKANKLYRIVTESPDKIKNLSRRCCNFKKLEMVLEKYLIKNKTI